MIKLQIVKTEKTEGSKVSKVKNGAVVAVDVVENGVEAVATRVKSGWKNHRTNHAARVELRKTVKAAAEKAIAK